MLMKTTLVILSIMLAFLFISCQRKEVKTYETVEELVETMKTQVEYISPVNLKAALDSEDQFYLIDCREPDEFSIACIQGAVSVPRGVLEDEISLKAPSKRTTLYIYCKNGSRSTLAATVLPKLKYKKVKVLEGGFDLWQEMYPELVEVNPVRGEVKKTPVTPSGGCGG
jgi:rhodanese-related sulfurtransferase